MGDLVTIAIAVHNDSMHLERCIDSVLMQEYTELEVIIVDDGSTDDSLEKCNKYENDVRVRVISKENGGLSSVRQLALNEAKGQFICFIDADDYIGSNYVQHLLDRISSENSDICVCSTFFVSEKGSILHRATDLYSFSREIDTVGISNENLVEDYYYLLRTYFMCDSWNKMYRVSFLKAARTTFEVPKGLNGSDLAYNHKILLHNPRISTIKDKDYYHVIYCMSAVHRKNKQLHKTLEIVTAQIINECICSENNAVIDKQIPSVYFSFLRDAFQDVYEELANNRKECSATFKCMMQEHKKFIENSGIIIGNMLPTKSLKVFSMLMNISSIGLLKLYFGVRGKSLG